jgi:Family of unknown function (DUF6492)
MATMSVVTPSYRPDLELCRDLHESVRRFGPAGMHHRVVVPTKDRALFAGIGEVQTVDAFLPRSFHALPGNLWLNLRRPMPLVRGWIAQQLIKLATVAASNTDLVLLVDSDMVFVRPFDETLFYRDGTARFYRLPDAIDERLPRHVLWHRVARRLLGLPKITRLPLPDYICWPMCWDPKIVRAALAHVERVTGRPWATAIGSEMHFSEGILYGVFVDEVLGGSAFTEQTMLSIAYSEETPLNEATISAFVATLSPADIAVMISAKSATARAVRRRALAAMEGQGSALDPLGP